MREIFDSYIDNAFDGYQQAEFKFKQFEINYKQHFPHCLDAAILDIGIGRGEMLTCMKNWGYRNYEGIDISVSTVNYCKSIGLRCTLVEDTASWLGERSENFELITLLDVLEHIRKEDTIYFLKFLRKSLINGGKLIIQVPNLQSPDGQLHRYNDFTHEVGFTEHSMRQVLLVAGFDKFQFYGFESITSKSVRACIRTRLRNIFWQYIKITRTINGNLNPRILNPVLFSVVTK